MKIPNYIIVTGYYGDENDTYRQKLYTTWLQNTLHTTRHHPPKAIYVINAGGHLPKEYRGSSTQWIDLGYNLGHVCDTMATGRIPFKHGLCGWTMSTLIGAFLAFSSNCDLIYKEQDCLAFGDWVPEMFKILQGNIKMTCGNLSDVLPFKIEQSLFGMKYDFLIEFVRCYLQLILPDWQIVPEHKWAILIEKEFKGRFKYLTFGYGRDRPVNYDDDIFYVQHDPHDRVIGDDIFKELRKRKLICEE